MIDTVIFDLGGVIVDIDRDRSVKAFEALGLKEAGSYLDPYHQSGIFLELEDGRLDAEGFCERLGRLCGRPVSFLQAQQAWMKFIAGVSVEKLAYVDSLRKDYRVCLLSNTNPFIMEWARSPRFTPAGRALDDYFDQLFLSYIRKCVKPHRKIFRDMTDTLGTAPENALFIDDGPANIATAKTMGFITLMPENRTNWIPDVQKVLANSVTSRNRER
ncbi:MAG: HAD family phosphatase [Bacteroidales bacterium]|nr:HAD family phosphatase [Bacteroidales bacterium]OQB66914.1 MAG: Alpha-D-glucose-1-phosphate phosphatase YihX [Bacteroidetes bacterium ADurb.Bin139]HPB78326.1 HAD family phosphatase [Bacteroidales bacterium]HPK39525.1 HAD family phosphatase [Bacteroidales bacterium]HQN82483.1 HAD family phosphatase [Bacteroidales bacterium]